MKPDELGINGFVLKQDAAYLKLGTDAMLLSEFARVQRRARVCDLGAGNGAVSILLAARHAEITLCAVEIQPGAARLTQENVLLNHIENRMTVHCADLRKISELFPAGSFDTVVSNPPYLAQNSGLRTGRAGLLAARMEIDCTISDVCYAAAYLLKFGGVFSVVYRPERLADLFKSLSAYNLEPKRMRLVQNRASAEPSLVLLEARKGANPGIKHLPALMVRTETGAESDEIKKIYRRK